MNFSLQKGILPLAGAKSARASNLAIALLWLPPARRLDALLFYRFCRTIDDIADDPSLPPAEKLRLLGEWRAALEGGPGLPPELRDLFSRHAIPSEWPLALIGGCLRDVEPAGFADLTGLRAYCWQVACVVGLTSARLFGCTSPQTPSFAEELGYALQLTNIARDVRADAELGRIYLPRDLLARHGIRSIAPSPTPPPGLAAAVREIIGEARAHFARAIPPASDLRPLRPALAMRAIYWRLLLRIEKADFNVWEPGIRVPTWEKALGLLSAFRPA